MTNGAYEGHMTNRKVRGSFLLLDKKRKTIFWKKEKEKKRKERIKKKGKEKKKENEKK